MTIIRRIWPAIFLFFLAPLVAEFLLGDLPVTMLGSLVVLAPAYGGGALLIREVVRRTGRGWPSIALLALAYGILEEAFTTQTLFNPDYLGLHFHLLAPAYIPLLGIGAWWTLFVLTLHTVWSISVSIALAEAMVPARETTPWLHLPGLFTDAVLFLAACAAVTIFTIHQDVHHFIATVPQFAGAAFACVVIMVLAFRVTAPSRATPGNAPNPWLTGLGALVAGSIFFLVPHNWAWGAVTAYLALYLVVIACILHLSRRTGWNGRHRLALAAGAALTYAWHSFFANPVAGHGAMDHRIGNALFAAGIAIVIAIAARRTAAKPDKRDQDARVRGALR